MSKFFHNKEVELLAPAGNFEIFKEVVQMNCDAIYFGGKNFNMRLHKKDHNFSDEELKLAIDLAHAHGKKAYITVNNMYNDTEVAGLKEFLFYLNDIQPDGLIAQDISVLAIIKECGLNLDIHSSVMMNVHNLPTIKALREFGVTRVVLSREATLAYSHYLNGATDMELEYFVHGDMCVAHGSRCLYSGMLFGRSSNRGRCLKPCRWNYDVVHNDREYPADFPLAVRDMLMYENIPELIHAGITSFKIEGRMRDVEYLKMIVDAYGDAIDRYIAEPLSFERKLHSDYLHENRKRDTSTGYAFGRPGLANMNQRYEGTGKLFSSGKVFSVATEERDIRQERINKLKDKFVAAIDIEENAQTSQTNLAVKVNNLTQAQVAKEAGADSIYLFGDTFLPDWGLKKSELKEFLQTKGDTKVYLGLPHMMFDEQFEQYHQFLNEELDIDGLLATNLGNVADFSNFNLLGDYQLNLLNNTSAAFYQSLGLQRVTLSPEAQTDELITFIKGRKENAELIVHGSPTIMYMEHDLYENTPEDNQKLLYLKDEKGFEHPVHKDIYGRNHMLLYKDICYLQLLPELYKLGLRNFRLEIPHFDLDKTREIVELYRKVLDNITNENFVFEDLVQEDMPLTLGALEY